MVFFVILKNPMAETHQYFILIFMLYYYRWHLLVFGVPYFYSYHHLLIFLVVLLPFRCLSILLILSDQVFEFHLYLFDVELNHFLYKRNMLLGLLRKKIDNIQVQL